MRSSEKQSAIHHLKDGVGYYWQAKENIDETTNGIEIAEEFGVVGSEAKIVKKKMSRA